MSNPQINANNSVQNNPATQIRRTENPPSNAPQQADSQVSFQGENLRQSEGLAFEHTNTPVDVEAQQVRAAVHNSEVEEINAMKAQSSMQQVSAGQTESKELGSSIELSKYVSEFLDPSIEHETYTTSDGFQLQLYSDENNDYIRDGSSILVTNKATGKQQIIRQYGDRTTYSTVVSNFDESGRQTSIEQYSFGGNNLEMVFNFNYDDNGNLESVTHRYTDPRTGEEKEEQLPVPEHKGTREEGYRDNVFYLTPQSPVSSYQLLLCSESYIQSPLLTTYDELHK